MKFSFARVAVLSISVLSASLFSVKLLEIHIHWPAPPEQNRAQTGAVANPVSTSPPRIDVPPTRISFLRGTTGQTVSGNVARGRDYVLRAKEGQHLTASVSSANGCVVFSPGTTSVSLTTVKGDNRLGLINNCGAESAFSLTVSIL
jgi:hypothetical protein